jgi:hypothetical protein
VESVEEEAEKFRSGGRLFRPEADSMTEPVSVFS